jgi:hypothetical protein
VSSFLSGATRAQAEDASVCNVTRSAVTVLKNFKALHPEVR